MQRPLILVTNDDGIDSEGLWAVVKAALPLGEVLVVAPDRQWSGGGRALSGTDAGHVVPRERQINGERVLAYAVDASPALAVVHAVLELAPRRPSLVVSGVNFGVNLGSDVTISGTVGAALEASTFGIPAMALSLEMDPRYHLTGDDAADYSVAMALIQQFGPRVFADGLPPDVNVLNINIPCDATVRTPWRLTRQYRGRYFVLLPREERSEHGPSFDYRPVDGLSPNDRDSDVWALTIDRIVAVTPLSLDLTSRVDFDTATSWLSTGSLES
jgi:5'-nucleotidase